MSREALIRHLAAKPMRGEGGDLGELHGRPANNVATVF